MIKRLKNRRLFLQQSAFAAAAFATPGLLAEELTKTSPVGEGPFYPDKLPLDTDNDLLIINDAITPLLACGQSWDNCSIELLACGQSCDTE